MSAKWWSYVNRELGIRYWCPKWWGEETDGWAVSDVLEEGRDAGGSFDGEVGFVRSC